MWLHGASNSRACCCSPQKRWHWRPAAGSQNRPKSLWVGSSRDEQVQATVEAALREGGSQTAGLTYEDVERVLEGRDLEMTVEMPLDE